MIICCSCSLSLLFTEGPRFGLFRPLSSSSSFSFIVVVVAAVKATTSTAAAISLDEEFGICRSLYPRHALDSSSHASPDGGNVWRVLLLYRFASLSHSSIDDEMDGFSTIVIQCSTIDHLPPIVTYIDTNEDVGLTWSELCRRTIEDDYLHSSTYLLTLLRNIHNSSISSTDDATRRRGGPLQRPRQRRQLAYRLRYDLGMGTIIKPTWSESSPSPTSSSRAGVRGVRMDKDDDEEEEEACYYYIDVNVYLQSANNGLKFEPYESILSSLSKGGGGREDTTTTTTTTTTKTTFVNLHISPVRYEEDSDDDDDEVHRRRPFPITSKLTRMLICKEHDYYSNYIATSYYFIIDDKNVGTTIDDDNNCHHDDAVVHFLRNARCVNSHKDGKEEAEGEEFDNDASAMIETYNVVMESTNKVTDEDPAQHDSAINSGQVDDAHENMDEACNNDRSGDGVYSSDEDTSSSSSSSCSSSSSDDDDDDASRENNQQRVHDTRENCKADSVGESLLNKQIESKLSSPSKNALKRMRRTNNDPAANKTNEEAMHHVDDIVSGGVGSGEESGGIIEAQKTGTPSLSSKEKSIFTLDTPFSAGASAGRKRRRGQQERDEDGPTDNCKSATTAVINENCNVTKTKNGDDPSSQKSLTTKVTTSAAAGKAESSLEYLRKKQAELRRTESSIVTIDARGAVPNCEDAIVTQVAGTTSKTICANSNVSTAEEDGGTTKIIKVGTSKKRILTKKRQEDQEEGKKTNERSPVGSITSFNSSEFIIPTAESDKHIPSKVAVGFPPGWTMRLISRIVNNKKRGSNWYYSPKLKYPFLTKGKANEFVKLLEQTHGDEKEAMILLTKKGKGKKTAVDVCESVSSLPLVDELDLDGNNNTAKAIAATTKRPKRTNDATKALHELASKQVVETLTADVEQSQSKKRKAKLTTRRNTKEKNTKR